MTGVLHQRLSLRWETLRADELRKALLSSPAVEHYACWQANWNEKRLFGNLATLRRHTRKVQSFILLGFAIYLLLNELLFRFITRPLTESAEAQSIWLAVVYIFVSGLAFGITIAICRHGLRFTVSLHILLQLSYLAIQLKDWGSEIGPPHDRKCAIISRLESCASYFEWFPLAYGLQRDVSSRAQVGKSALGIAARFRKYKVSVAMPNGSTETELNCAVGDALVLISNDRWFDLPGGRDDCQDAALAPGLKTRLAWGAAFALIVGAIIGVAIFRAELGPEVSGFAGSMLSLFLVIVLTHLGANLVTLQQAVNISGALRPKA